MDIAITKLKTGYIIGEWDDKVYSARQAFSTLDDLIAALPGIFEPVDSAPPEIEPTSALGVWIEESGDITPEWYSQRGVPVDGEVPASELNSIQPNGAADADPS